MGDRPAPKDGTAIIGRDEEMEELCSLLDDLTQGVGTTVLISGEPGVGKSALVDAVNDMARKEGVRVLESRCVYGSNQPYLPIQQALFDGKDPSLDMFVNDGDQQLNDKEMLEAYRNAAFYETAESLKDVVEKRPHIIFIDNLHWADRGSLNLFHYLADRLRDQPVLFIGAYQPGDAVPGSAFIDTKQQMSRKKLFTDMELEPLCFEDMREMVEGMTNTREIPQKFLEILYKKTKGNPMFVKESLHQMIETGIICLDEKRFPKDEDEFTMPDLIQDVVERRVFRLDDKAREVLQLGSVIGENVPFSLLVEASSLDEFDLLDQIDKLIENRLWIEKPDEEIFQFSHDIITDTIYRGIGKWVERKKLHLSVAEAMEELNDVKLYPVLAEHYLEAEEYDTARDHFHTAATKAEEVYAHEDAISLYNKALDTSDKLSEDQSDLDILEDLAEAQRLMGDYENSLESLYRGLNHVKNRDDEQRIYRKIAGTWQEHGEFQKALDLVEKRLLLEEEDTLERCILLGKKGWSLMQVGRYEEALETFEEEKDVAKKIGDEKQESQAYHDLGSIFIRTGRFDDAMEELTKAKEIREETGDLNGLSKTLNNISAIHTFRGDLDRSLKEYKRCVEVYEEMGDISTVGKILNNIGATYQKKGDRKKAIEHLEKGYELSQRVDNRFTMCNIQVNMAQVYIDEGDYEKAEDTLLKTAKLAKGVNYLEGAILSKFLLTKLAVERGDLEKAESYLKSLTDSVTSSERSRDKGFVPYLEGLMLRERGDPERAVAELEEAIDIFHRSSSPDMEATSRYELGRTFKVLNESDKATGYIQEALDHFERRGMRIWVKRCEEALR